MKAPIVANGPGDAAPSAAPAGAEMSFWMRNQMTLAPLLFLLPALIMFLIYVIYPIVQSIRISFYDWTAWAR